MSVPFRYILHKLCLCYKSTTLHPPLYKHCELIELSLFTSEYYGKEVMFCVNSINTAYLECD